MAKDYDVGKAFRQIEMELIQSMQRNMNNHVKQQYLENIKWTQWQSEMLKGFSIFKTENADKLPGYFSTINREIDSTIKQAYEFGKSEQEIKILKAIKNGYVPPKSAKGVSGEFFKINERKLNALIKATTSDVKKAETAVLRMTNDVYRKTIFNAQVFANTGAGTIEQAVDMATKDFLSTGINCVQYSNGARVNIASYASMAVRTANKRAYLQGEAQKREEWGIHTVYVSAHNTACPLCVDWQGQVYIDDEFGEGTASESKDTSYPLLSDAVAGGLFHPNCRNTMTTYFEGVNDEPVPPTDEEKAEQQLNYEQTQKENYNKRQILRYQRLKEGSLDEENKAKYATKEKQWRERQSLLKKPSIGGIINKSSGLPSSINTPSVKEEYLKKLSENNDADMLATGKVLKKKATPDELEAITKYTGHSYREMNGWLRFGGDADLSIKDACAKANAGLGKVAIDKEIVIRRGTNTKSLESLVGSFGTDIHSLSGKIICDKGFFSCSPFATGGFMEDVTYYIKCPKGTSGAYVDDISLHQGEKEFLLNSGTTFRIQEVVKKVDKGKVSYEVFMDVVL